MMLNMIRVVLLAGEASFYFSHFSRWNISGLKAGIQHLKSQWYIDFPWVVLLAVLWQSSAPTLKAWGRLCSSEVPGVSWLNSLRCLPYFAVCQFVLERLLDTYLEEINQQWQLLNWMAELVLYKGCLHQTSTDWSDAQALSFGLLAK